MSSNRKKRSAAAFEDVSMEKRLENLLLSRADTTAKNVVITGENVANLLIQGLHSKDKQILQSVFTKDDENVVKNTIRRLPVQLLTTLFKELTTFIQSKNIWSQHGIIWMKNLLEIHASQLSSNPELSDLAMPVLGTIQNRLTILPALQKLKGRLDVVLAQISAQHNIDELNKNVPVFVDPDSDDSSEENQDIISEAESSDDHQWNENSSSEGEENGKSSSYVNGGDEEMSE